MTIKEKQIWSPEAVTRSFNYTYRYMYKYYKFKKKNQVPRATSSNITSFYKKLLQTLWKSILFVIEFFLVNSFISVFLGILRQVSQQLPCKTQLSFGISLIILSICCCHFVVYYLTKPLWNCVSASRICWLSLSLPVWLNM